MSGNRATFLILLGALLVVLGGFYHFQDWQYTVFLTAGFCSLLLVGFGLFYHTRSYYLILIALLPISLDFNIVGDAKMAAPSEVMLLLLIPILILFHDNFKLSAKRIASHPITIFLLIDILIQITTTLTSAQFDVSVKRVVIRIIFIVGFFLAINSMENTKKLLQVWLAYAFGFVPVIYLVVRNHMNYDFDPKTVFAVCQPYFNDHTLYGACLAFVIPLLVLLLAYRKRFAWKSWQLTLLWITTIMVIVAEALALSRAAILSVLAALFFGILLRFKVRFSTMMIGLVLLVVTAISLRGPIYDYLEKNEAVSNDGEISNHLSSVTNIQTDASNLERVNRWVCAIRMFEDRPILGFGPGTYQFEYNKYQTTEHKTYISTNVGDKGNAHSEYLTYLSENGIFGAIIFLLTVFGAVYFGMQNHEQLRDPLLRIVNLGILLGLITYFFHGIFNSFMDQSKMAFLYFSALGTIVWINVRVKSKEVDVF